MSTSVYDISNWGNQGSYKKNEIVQFPLNSAHYFYALIDHTRATSDFTSATVYNTTKWSNGKENFNDQSTPHFMWEGSYGTQLIQEPRLKKVKFGFGVEHNYQDGINSDLITYRMSFKNRDLFESTAILHFLHRREGIEKFSFCSPKPFAGKKIFLAREWTARTMKRSYFDISVLFEEVSDPPYQLIQKNLTIP